MSNPWKALLDDLQASGLTPDEIRERIQPVGAVLTYRLEGTMRPHGQQIGADGRGDHAFVIHGDPDKADRWARDKIRAVIQTGHRMTAITVVTADGPHLEIIPEDT